LNQQKATAAAIRNTHSIAQPPPGVPAGELEMEEGARHEM